VTAVPLELVSHTYGKRRIHFVALPVAGGPPEGARDEEETVRTCPGTDGPVELTAEVMLTGGFEASYLRGDNRSVVTTDSLARLVFLTVERLLPAPVETLATTIVSELRERYRFVPGVTVDLSAQTWYPLDAGGSPGPRPRAFWRGGEDRQQVHAVLRDGRTLVRSGIGRLHLLATTGSSFEGFLVDDLTTSPPVADRPLYGIVDAEWASLPDATAWDVQRAAVRAAILESFESVSSRSVQELVAAMCGAVLSGVPAVDDVSVTFESLPLSRTVSGSPVHPETPLSLGRGGSPVTSGLRGATGRVVGYAIADHPQGVTTASMRRVDTATGAGTAGEARQAGHAEDAGHVWDAGDAGDAGHAGHVGDAEVGHVERVRIEESRGRRR